MKVAEIALLWEGTIALLVSIGTYIIGRWWKEDVTRYIVVLEIGLLVLVANSIVVSLTQPREFHPHLTYVIMYAIVMTYGAYAFIRVRIRARAANRTDDWTTK